MASSLYSCPYQVAFRAVQYVEWDSSLYLGYSEVAPYEVPYSCPGCLLSLTISAV